MKSCLVCSRPTISPRHSYCARCHRWCAVRKEIRARVKTLREHYDPSLDAFRCSYSGVVLNEADNKDPFFLCFDHRIPHKRHDITVCASLFNLMKSDLTHEEFPRVVKMLAERFRNGTPFDAGAVKFAFWSRHVKPRRPCKLSKRAWKEKRCLICGKPPVPKTRYCARCHRFADAPDFSKVQFKALADAYDPALDRFVCHYTGVPVDESDPGGPWYLNFDHVIPGDRSLLVVAAFFINVMKWELAEDEFRAVVLELARHLETGETFRKDIAKFEYWHGLS